MNLNDIYDEIINAVIAAFGIFPVRANPMNLRVELKGHSIAIGWNGTTYISDGIGGLEPTHQFIFGYFGTDEEELLKTLDKLELFINALPREATVGAATRIVNSEGVKMLDYGFTLQITIRKEVF